MIDLREYEKMYEKMFGRYGRAFIDGCEPPIPCAEITIGTGPEYDELRNGLELWREVQSGKTFASKWIPCNEMFPKDTELVLCTEKDTKKLYIGWFEIIPEVGARWFDYLGFSMEVEAWMPLPKAYKGDE